MIGRVYSWRGGLWRVVKRWQGKGPRNVLIEGVIVWGRRYDGDVLYERTGERVVRPFRGLRRA